MSGWDTSSRPSWGSQDDPEDGTKASPESDYPGRSDEAWPAQGSPLTDPGWGARQPGDSRDQGGFPEENRSSGPPPELFSPQQFAKREPGATLGGLGRRELSAARDRNGNGNGNGNGRGKHSADPAGGQQSALGGPAWQEPSRDVAPPWQEPSRDVAPPWQEPARDAVPPWQEPARNEPTRSESVWPDAGRQDAGRQDYGQQDYGQPDYGQPDPGRQELARREPGRAGGGGAGVGGAGVGGAGVGGAGVGGAGVGGAAQSPESPMAALSPDRLDREHGARFDPALQDFFGPGGPNRANGARPGPQDFQAPQDFSGAQTPQVSALGSRTPAGAQDTQAVPPRSPGARGSLPPVSPGPGLADSGQRYPGNGRGEPGPRRGMNNGGMNNGGMNNGGNGNNSRNGNNGISGSGSPWDDAPPRRPMTGPFAAAMTGPMLAVKGAAALVTPKENEPLRIRVLRFIGVGTVIVVAVVVGAYLLTHSSGTSPNQAGTGAANALPGTGGGTGATASPTATSTSASKAKSTTKGKTKAKSNSKPASTTDATQYTLSTPAVAGGYQMGQDPHFLATATATAQSILNTVSAGGGGTAKGGATSASYMLPSGDQVVTVVAYHGSFSPSHVISSMGSFGTTDGTYSDPADGGQIACANAPASGSTSSGAVCVWATSTTIGVTEFFDQTGPETLTASQDLGAEDTAKIQASVEAKK